MQAPLPKADLPFNGFSFPAPATSAAATASFQGLKLVSTTSTKKLSTYYNRRFKVRLIVFHCFSPKAPESHTTSTELSSPLEQVFAIGFPSQPSLVFLLPRVLSRQNLVDLVILKNFNDKGIRIS